MSRRSSILPRPTTVETPTKTTMIAIDMNARSVVIKIDTVMTRVIETEIASDETVAASADEIETQTTI